MMHVAVGPSRLEVPEGASLLPFAEEIAVLMMIEKAVDPVPRLYTAWLSGLRVKLHRSAAARPWSILRVKPGMEAKVTEVLRGAGLGVHHPRERYRPARTWRSRTRPLIPGYLFVDLPNDEAIDLARGNEAVIEVMCRTMADGRPKPVQVPALVVGAFVLAEWLGEFDTARTAPPPANRRRHRRPPSRKWEAGELVRIAEGPLEGRTGKILAAERADRMLVLIEIFGRMSEVTLDEEMIEAFG